MIYSFAGYVVAKLIAVDISRRSTRLYRPDVFSLQILIYRVYTAQICIRFADRFDTPPMSTHLCRPEKRSLQFLSAADKQIYRAGGIQLRHDTLRC